MILVGFLIPVSSCISLFRAWVLVSPFSMPPVMGCQNFPVVDVLFSSRYCVFVLVFLYRMAWTCIGNLMPRKRDYNEWYKRLSGFLCVVLG